MVTGRKTTFGIRVRSVLFYALSVLVFLPFVLCAPVLMMPSRYIVAVCKAYLWIQLGLLRWVCGISYQIEGIENLPEGPYLIASQHESSWETLFFQILLPAPVMFAKKEVFSYPVIGLLARRFGHVPVDRAASVDAMRETLSLGVDVLQSGRTLLIFPAGTRRRADKNKIQSGVAVLYAKAGVPVVPVALNSGACWPSGSLVKYPGRIVVRILPPILPGLDRRDFLGRLSDSLSVNLP